MKTPLCLLTAAALIAPMTTTDSWARHSHRVPATQDKKPAQPIKMKVIDVNKVLAKLRAGKRKYTPFFKVPSLNTGIYTLPKGQVDGQSPDGQDELYYVLLGKAKMQSDGREKTVVKASLVFVAAGATHRFIDIEEDL